MSYFAGLAGQITIANGFGVTLSASFTTPAGDVVPVYSDATRETLFEQPVPFTTSTTFYVADDEDVVVSVLTPAGTEVASAPDGSTLQVSVRAGAAHSFNPDIDLGTVWGEASAASLVQDAALVGLIQAESEGSVLGETKARPHGTEKLMKEAVWWIDSAQSGANGQAVANLGWGGGAITAQAGETSGAEASDPTFYDYTGTSYVVFPGTSSNSLTVPCGSVSAYTDLDIAVYVGLADWSPSADQVLFSQYNPGDSAFSFEVDTSGKLQLIWSGDGTAVTTEQSTEATGFDAAAQKWVRAVLDRDVSGAYNVLFYTGTDGVTWSQLGSTVVGGAVATVFASTEPFCIGARATSSLPMAGVFNRAVLRDGIDGNVILDVDASSITSGGVAEFRARSGQTVTVNRRSATGAKTLCVTHPVWVFNGANYFEVADNDAFDFTAAQSFTVLAVQRPVGTVGTNDVIVAKKANTTVTTAGWALGGGSTAATYRGQVGDGTIGLTAIGPSARTENALAVVALVRDAENGHVRVNVDGTSGAKVADTTTASILNTGVLRVGRLAGAGTEWSDMEGFSFAVFRRELTDEELLDLAVYFHGRIA